MDQNENFPLALATDCVVFGFDGKTLHILLIERGNDPFKGSWSLPGGLMRKDETAEQCALRTLREETGVREIYLEQFHVFSDVSRDPRQRVVAVAFLALARKSDFRLIAGDDAARASWFELDELPPVAFDHRDMIALARKKLPEIMRTKPIGFRLLDEKFSMNELQRLYETVNGTTYDRRNFARKMSSTRLLRDEGVSRIAAHNRFPNLFSFDEEAYREETDGQIAPENPFNI